LLLTITAGNKDGRCNIRFSWQASDSGKPQLPDGRTVLAKDIPTLEELLAALGGELTVAEHEAEVLLTLPAAPAASAPRPDLVH
jgi:hypothetical protein